MNITEKKPISSYPDQIKKLFDVLKFKNTPISIQGSASIESLAFPADYDLKCYPLKLNCKDAYDEFCKILKLINDDPDYFILELKLEKKKGKSIKWNPNNHFDEKKFCDGFEDINYFKIDLAIRINKIFEDVNCLYKFVDKPVDINTERSVNQNDINELKISAKEMEKEGDFYKALKRRYSLYGLLNDQPKLVELSKFFNSDIGKLNRLKSRLELIDKMNEYYSTPQIKKMIDVELKNLGQFEYINDLPKRIDQLSDIINKASKSIIKQYNIR